MSPKKNAYQQSNIIVCEENYQNGLQRFTSRRTGKRSWLQINLVIFSGTAASMYREIGQLRSYMGLQLSIQPKPDSITTKKGCAVIP